MIKEDKLKIRLTLPLERVFNQKLKGQFSSGVNSEECLGIGLFYWRLK